MGSYGESEATSPPGYPLLVAAPLALVERGCSCDAYLWIGFVVLPLLVVAAVCFADRVGARLQTRSAAIVAFGTLFAPGVIHSLTDLYHPQDLAALALVLLSARTVVASNEASADAPSWKATALAGGCAGLAMAVRQWALLPMAVAAVWLPARRSLFIAGATSVVAVVCLPFVIWDTESFVRALTAPDVIKSMTVVGRLPLSPETTQLIARGGPLLVAAGLVLVFGRAWRRPTSARAARELVLGMLAVLLVRLAFEPVLYQYYLAPSAVLGVIWAAGSARRLLLLLLGLAAVTNFRAYAIGDGGGAVASASALAVTITAAAVWAATAIVLERQTITRSAV